MKRLLAFLVLLLTLTILLSGCYLKSVHPLITNEQAKLITGVDGVYESDDARWTFASDENPVMIADLLRGYPDKSINIEPGESDSLNMNAYLIKMEPLDDSNEPADYFIGMIGEINNQLYLNLRLFQIDFGVNTSFGALHTFNVNTFSRITIEDNQIVMEPFASEWIAELIQNNQVRIKHERVYSEFDDSTEILITASNRELRQFVEKYGDQDEAYQDKMVLTRLTDEI